MGACDAFLSLTSSYRFVQVIEEHIHTNFKHTLQFDRDYMLEKREEFAKAIGTTLGLPNPEECRCLGFLDGKFQPHCFPTYEQYLFYNGHYGGHG